jgi:predicted ribosomally synthesized peptide with SipW-like signal peptide
VRRTVLSSLVVIGAVIAVVFGSGTFAPFTDTTTGTGSVTATTIDVVADADTDDSFTISFTPQDLLPGETSSDTFTINNAGTRDFHLTWPAIASTVSVDAGHTSCATATYVLMTGTLTDVAADDHAGNYHIANGATENFTISLKLLDVAGVDANCQGATFSVSVTFTATGVADGA